MSSGTGGRDGRGRSARSGTAVRGAVLLAALSGALVATSGCHSSASHQSGPASVVLPAGIAAPDPCSLVTTDQVSAALGRPMGSGGPVDAPSDPSQGRRDCFWSAEGDKGTLLSLNIVTNASLHATESGPMRHGPLVVNDDFDATTNPNLPMTDIPGLGLRARWWTSLASTTVAVVTDDAYLEITFTASPGGAAAPATSLIQLAGLATSAIPSSRSTVIT